MPRLSFTPFTLAAVSMWLQACGGMPPSADESRQATRGAMATKTETFEVNRPVREVAATLQQQAPECLDIAVGTVLRTFASQQNILTEYRATVVADGERAELQLQQLQKSAAVAPSKLSTSGAAVVVAEATALPGNRTRMQLSGPSAGYDVVYRALRGWASGDNLACPDLTKVGKLSS